MSIQGENCAWWVAVWHRSAHTRLNQGNGASDAILGTNGRTDLLRACQHVRMGRDLLQRRRQSFRRKSSLWDRRRTSAKLRYAAPPERLVAKEWTDDRWHAGCQSGGSSACTAMVHHSSHLGEEPVMRRTR